MIRKVVPQATAVIGANPEVAGAYPARMRAVPAAPAAIPLVAAATFLAAFGVADVTGVRALGGLVLVAGGAWCALRVRPAAGTPRTIALVAFALVAFVASHPLGDVLGAWPAVVLVAAAVGFATVRLQRPVAGDVHLAR